MLLHHVLAQSSLLLNFIEIKIGLRNIWMCVLLCINMCQFVYRLESPEMVKRLSVLMIISCAYLTILSSITLATCVLMLLKLNHDHDQIISALLHAQRVPAVTWPDPPWARQGAAHGSRPAAALRNDTPKMNVNTNFQKARVYSGLWRPVLANWCTAARAGVFMLCL